MRISGKIFLFLILIFAAGACFEPPNFSTVPAIDTPVTRFVAAADASAEDSLIITFNFRDGDGNLGLGDDDDNDRKFANKFYFLTPASADYDEFGPIYIFPAGNTFNRVPKPGDELITYETKRTVPGYDTLPPFTSPYSCTRWQVVSTSDPVSGHETYRDTLLFEFNPNHYNIFLDIYVQNFSTGHFDYFDWATEFPYPGCQVGFSGRFPVLASDLSKTGPLEGKMQYAIPSSGWKSFFDKKVLQLKITILDRDLQRSNTITTPSFTIQ